MKKIEVIGLIVILIIIAGASYGLWYFSKPPLPRLKVEKELEVFTIGLDKDIDGIHPYTQSEVVSMSVNGEIFSGLSDFTREGSLVPGLAENWFNPDNLTWEIVLKKGVKFHNGKEMTAQDVEFSLINVPQAVEDFYGKESVAQVDRVEIIDAYRIKIFTKKPYPLLMNDLAGFPIMSKDYVEKEGFEANPVGTGPYKFIKWEKGKEIVLERFEDYHGEKPIPKRVVYKIIPEEEKRIESLISGDIDFAIQLTLDGLEKMEGVANIKAAITPSIGITFLGMDTAEKTVGIELEKNPLRNANVRKAIAYAIDKDLIIREAFGGRATKATQISVAESFGYNPEIKVYPYDPDKAKELLSEAGYPDGFEVELYSPDDDRAKAVEIIGRELSQIGVKAKVNILPRGKFFDKLFGGEATMFLLTILDTALDAAGLSTAMYHTPTEEYGSLNLVNYSNPEVDDLIEKAMGTLDQEARKRYAQEIMRVTIEEEIPYIPLYISEFLGGVREDLEFSQRPDGNITINDLKFAE